MERSDVARTNRCTVALKRAEWSRQVDVQLNCACVTIRGTLTGDGGC